MFAPAFQVDHPEPMLVRFCQESRIVSAGSRAEAAPSMSVLGCLAQSLPPTIALGLPGRD